MKTLPSVDLVIVGGGWTGLLMAKELGSRTTLSVVVLERGGLRKTDGYGDDMDELDYATRLRMMQDASRETVTLRHTYTSDGGLILVRELDQRLGLGDLIAEHLSDHATRGLRRMVVAVYSTVLGNPKWKSRLESPATLDELAVDEQFVHGDVRGDHHRFGSTQPQR